jgi:hypothetical protein
MIVQWLSEIWGAMWPNIFAPSFFTLLGVFISHIKLHNHINKKHAETKAHVADLLDPNTPGGLGDINVQTSEKS